MPLEIEAKFRVESHEPVRERLRALEAVCLGQFLETNWIFDRTDDWLRKRDCGLRIRSSVSASRGDVTSTFTVKGPRLSGTLKSREEREFVIGDADAARGALELLGYTAVLEYQKRRESWTVGPCRVELDEPPLIGLFVEIEGPNEKEIHRVQGQLGLEGQPHVRESYVHMLVVCCDERGISRTTSTRCSALSMTTKS